MKRIQIRARADAAIRSQLRIGYDHRRYSHRMAEAVIDAVLPQITTVAQLEALPVAALLVGDDGADDRRDGWLSTIEFTGREDLVFPLTVVWQP